MREMIVWDVTCHRCSVSERFYRPKSNLLPELPEGWRKTQTYTTPQGPGDGGLKDVFLCPFCARYTKAHAKGELE